MLEDRPREDEGTAPPEEPAEGGTPFNPLFLVAGAVIAAVSGVMAVSGLLIPALVFGGAFLLFLLVQVLMFKVFPPPKS